MKLNNFNRKAKYFDKHFKPLYLSFNSDKIKIMKDESFKFPNITVNEKDYLKHLTWLKLNFDKK